MSKIIETKTESGDYSLSARRHEYVITFNNDRIGRYKVSKLTMQEVIAKYNDIITKSGTKILDSIQYGLGYVSINLEKKSGKELYNVVSKLSVKDLLNSSEYHFTLFFDKRNPILPIEELERNILFEANAVDIQVLGESNKAIAIIFESESLVKRFEYLKSFGFKHDFDALLPHCTIKYNPTEKDIDLILSKKDDILSAINTIILKKEVWRKAICF
ncbi:MAG: hypothetical protein CL760_11705 [Chloroflexi bacterium]|nr:hypothetical protein [Chloroflexota bacterium]|tara:strand:+ start:83412 stop:84059 length:648 start_codon:yes stop_codon:yes gene_type:complete